MIDAEAAARRIWGGRVTSIEPLGGGITNHNFKVTADGEAYVLRIGGADTDLLGIDRRTERVAAEMAAAIGIGPAVVTMLEPEGWLVTRFIAGTPIPPEAMREPAGITRVATALRRLHGGPPIEGRFDAHRVVEEYRDLAAARGVPPPPRFELAHARALAIEAARGPQLEVPCHNDLLNANFLDDGEIRIVDWEYAGMGDRFFDLGNLATNHAYGALEEAELLRAYFGAVRPGDLAALRLMRFMSDFREAMWGVLQSAISGLDFDFHAYAAEHFDRLEAAAAEPGFEAALAEAGQFDLNSGTTSTS